VNECKHEIFFCGDCGTSLDDATTDLRRQLADKEAHYKALELFIEHLRQKPVYVVTMYRWGNRENHSYVATVSLDADKARQMAEQEEIDRGGKYQAEVIEVPVDDTDGEKFIDILALKPHPAFSKGADRGVLRELESAEAREKAMVAALAAAFGSGENRRCPYEDMTGDPVGADFCEKCLLSELCSIDPAALSTPPAPSEPCQCAELREALVKAWKMPDDTWRCPFEKIGQGGHGGWCKNTCPIPELCKLAMSDAALTRKEADNG
jgi:hypothetical protein